MIAVHKAKYSGFALAVFERPMTPRALRFRSITTELSILRDIVSKAVGPNPPYEVPGSPGLFHFPS